MITLRDHMGDEPVLRLGAVSDVRLDPVATQIVPAARPIIPTIAPADCDAAKREQEAEMTRIVLEALNQMYGYAEPDTRARLDFLIEDDGA